ncbi:MAG: hypothetical protein ABW292_07735 [Vicinamibacterales bacterium]
MPSAEPPVRAPGARPRPQADSGTHRTVISNLAFSPNLAGAAKLSIFAASIVSTAAGVVVLAHLSSREPTT